jgi:hypothetical protein
LIKEGFEGRSLSNNRETYQLRMHLTHAYDVLSGVSKALRVSRHQDEIAQACDMVKSFESGSITLYDRLYLSKDLIRIHLKKRNYFVMRAKNKSTLKQIVEALKLRKSVTEIEFEGIKLRVVRCKNTKTNSHRYFLTNLSMAEVSAKRVDLLYRERWDVEASFKELTDSLQLESWHSRDFNCILQELYARFWMYNFTKIQIYLGQTKNKRRVGTEYFRANTRACVQFIISNFMRFLRRVRSVFKELRSLIKKSTERRVRYKRSYPRVLKYPGSPYPTDNTVWRIK